MLLLFQTLDVRQDAKYQQPCSITHESSANCARQGNCTCDRLLSGVWSNYWHQGKFCLNEKCKCNVSSHFKAERFDPNSLNAFMTMKAPKTNAGLFTPFLDTNSIPESKITELLATELGSSMEWSFLFTSILLDTEVASVKTIAMTTRKAPKTTVFDTASASGFPSGYDWKDLVRKHEEAGGSNPPQSWKEDLSRENKEEVLLLWGDRLEALSRSVSSSDILVGEVVRGLESTLPSILASLQDFGDNAKGAWVSIRHLEDSLGPVPSDPEIPTLWQAFESFKEATSKTFLSTQNAVGRLQATLANNNGEMANVMQSFQDLHTGVSEVLGHHTKAIRDLQKRKVNENPVSGPGGNSFNFNSGLNPSSLSNSGYGTGASGSQVQAAQDMMRVVEELKDRLNKLEASTNQDARSMEGHEVVTVGGHIFRNIEDTMAWLTTYVGTEVNAMNSGVFTDPLVILHRVHGNLTNNHSALKEISIRATMKMSRGEEIMLQALQVGIPKIFSGDMSKDKIFTGVMGKGKAAKGPGRFKNCPTFSAWEDDQHKDGLRYQILKQLPNIRSETLSDIHFALGSKPEAKALAITLLSQSISFVEHLVDFISDAYREINKSESTSAQSWDLVCYVIVQIFIASFEKARKSVGSAATDPTNRLTFGGHLLLASLRTVQVGGHLEYTGLQNHPIVSASYTKFILSNVNAGEVRDLREEVTCLTAKLEATAHIADAAKRTADQAVTASKAAKIAADAAAKLAKKS